MSVSHIKHTSQCQAGLYAEFWGLYCAPTFQADSRWNMDSVVFHIIPYYSTLFHNIPHYAILFHIIPQYSTWIPHYSTLFHMDSILFHMDSTLFHMDSTLFHIFPYGFHMDSTHFHIESQTIIKYSSWGHQTNLVFCSVHWVRSHDFPKPAKIFKSMTFKIITHYVYIYYISKKKH